MKVLVAQLCPTLCDPMDCSPSGSSVHGILRARVLEGVAMPSSGGSSWPRDFPGDSDGQESACNAGDLGSILEGQEDPLEEGMAVHSSILDWRIPWTEEPGRQQSIGSHMTEVT